MKRLKTFKLYPMKHIKTYRLFESIDEERLEDLFLELSDEGFGVSVKKSWSQKLDFSVKDHFSSGDLQTKNYTIPTFDVKVEKRGDEYQTIFVEFNIDQIKDTLEFAESYVVGELGLELEYIYVVKIPNYTYYKSVDVLPDNLMVDSITFAFRKKEEN